MSEETLKPRLIVVAGPNGTGKTSITEIKCGLPIVAL
jgi:ABC-type Mn2+/Zn2+ transport system ATPase subunit